jgi:hypothetical protein
MAFIQSCPNCGMSRDDWQGDGYTKDRETYCCRGCADGTGCTCRQDEKNRAAFTNAE